jgi:pilus assembly protein CpaD
VTRYLIRKDATMRTKLALLALTCTVAGCSYTPHDQPDRGLAAVNVPVVTTADYGFDVAAPSGSLAPGEGDRLNAWFQALALGYGDTVYVDGPYYDGARAQVAAIAGQYGMLVQPGAPVTAGAVQPGNIRVVVARRKAEVPGCPNWSVPSHPNYNNRSMSNFGCSMSTNLAAMVADPQDLIHGRAGDAASDAATGAKAIQMYRGWPLTGVIDGQARRPLKRVDQTTKGQ